MEQEKIEWTLDVISQLLQEGVGDQKKINNIKYNLQNNSDIQEKDVKYLKKQFEELEKKEKIKLWSTCSRCDKPLGFRKYKAGDYTRYERLICHDCWSHINKNHLTADGKYIEGTLYIKYNSDVKIHSNNFDEGSLAITSKQKNYVFPIENLKTVYPVFREENSFKKKILTAGHQNKATTGLLEIKIADDNMDERIILKTKNVEGVMEDIQKLQRISRDRGYKESTLEPAIQKEKKPIETKFTKKYGNIIKYTNMAQYYGGHKAYLAGGTFSDSQNGDLYLTEDFIIFQKAAIRSSKRWMIKIPLDKVIVGEWTIDEKVRRKSMVGGGAGLGFGLFGGVGAIHDSGKSHDIVVPFIDENGIQQAPRFGVTSITGNAIKDWAKLIYETLVKVHREKQLVADTKVEEPKVAESKKSNEDPLKILKLRLAKGEITKEEFEELKELID